MLIILISCSLKIIFNYEFQIKNRQWPKPELPLSVWLGTSMGLTPARGSARRRGLLGGFSGPGPSRGSPCLGSRQRGPSPDRLPSTLRRPSPAGERPQGSPTSPQRRSISVHRDNQGWALWPKPTPRQCKWFRKSWAGCDLPDPPGVSARGQV